MASTSTTVTLTKAEKAYLATLAENFKNAGGILQRIAIVDGATDELRKERKMREREPMLKVSDSSYYAHSY